MEPCMNNPWNNPEQFQYHGPRLDPEYDDIPEPQPIFQFTELDNGLTYEVYGEEARDEIITNLTDDGVPFECVDTGREGFDPDAII